MTEQFLHLDWNERKEILESLALEFERGANVLEKDIWVCWALDAMFSIPNSLPIAFKGGTSLSKVFNAISRFSEDIDITVDYRALADSVDDDFDPFSEGVSNSQVRKFSDRLKEVLKAYASEKVIPHIQSQVNELPFAEQMKIEHSDDGEKIWLHFPSLTAQEDDYVRSSVLVELGGRNIIIPNATHDVLPDASERLNEMGLAFPTAKAVVLSPERTFWEKVTLIHAECGRESIKANAERLSRHWYDLYRLTRSKIGPAAMGDRDLLKDVVKHKKCFYRSAFANYDACLTHDFKLIPDEAVINHLKNDYMNMRGMIYGEVPAFEEIIQTLTVLEKTLNKPGFQMNNNPDSFSLG